MAEITKAIVVDAPPSVVFKALTDEKELVRWMPQEARMDARIGGKYEFRYVWAARNLEATARGEIIDLVPDKRLSYTFVSTQGGSGPGLSSVVTWTLEELPDGKTRVTLVLSRAADGAGAAWGYNTEAGWGYFLGQLASRCGAVVAGK